METEVKSDNICRCCLQEKSDLKNMLQEIFNLKNDGQISLLEGYTICSGVELRSENNYKSICRKCEKNLKISYDFRELCRDSNEVLLERAGLTDVKTEVLSDTEDNGQDSFVYSEYAQHQEKSDSSSQVYRHQVFVKAGEKGVISMPAIKIKSEERPSKPVVTREPENVGVEVILKEERQQLVKQDAESDDDRHQDPDYDSYDDDDDVKDRKHAAGEEHSGDENIDTFLLEGNYACPLCELILDNFRDFKSHRKTHLWDSGLNFIKRTCEICHKFTDKYLHHIKYEHADHKPNTCRQCDMSFNQPNQLHKHLLTHLEGKRFPCKGCKQKFANTIQLKNHISRIKHFENLYQCQECGMTFPVFTEFLEHFNKTHYEDTAHRKFYPCIDCKNIFYRRQQAQNHNCDASYSLQVANMNEKEFTKYLGAKPKTKKKKKPLKVEQSGENVVKPHECDRCSERFLTEDEMVCHQHSLCDGKIRHFCTPCNREFQYQELLRRHNINHHGSRNVVCDICGSTWPDELKLRSHQISHSQERSYQCDIPGCDRKFKRSDTWKRHKITHKARQVECYHCKKTFRSLSTIQRHMARHMQVTPAEFKCDLCPKMFRLLIDKTSHQRNHLRPTFPCHLCCKVYSHQGGLRHHVEFIHNGIRYNCNICNQSLADRRQLYEHYFLHRGFKPYQCTACSRQEVKKDRFKKHLKQHNIKYDDKLHGYIEKDPTIHKIIEECIKTTAKKPAKGAASAAEGHASGSRSVDSGGMEFREGDNSHTSNLPPLHQMCQDYPTF